MTYILSFVVVAIAVVLAIFTGIWGGLVWIVAAGIVLAIVVAVRGRTIESERTTPTGRPRASNAPGTANERVQVLARALGARDLALGAGGLLALREADSDRARRWFAAQGVTDAVDFVATVAARGIPLPARIFAAAMAAGSAAIAGAYVACVERQISPSG